MTSLYPDTEFRTTSWRPGSGGQGRLLQSEKHDQPDVLRGPLYVPAFEDKSVSLSTGRCSAPAAPR